MNKMKKTAKRGTAKKDAGGGSSQTSSEFECGSSVRQTRQRKRRSIRLRNLISVKRQDTENIYDGDVENNSDSSSSNQESKSSQSREIYDFDLCENELKEKLDISSSETKKPSPTTRTGLTRKVASARLSSKRPHGVGDCENSRKKLKATYSEVTTIGTRKTKRAKSIKRSVNNCTADSGIFMTPPSLCTSGPEPEKATTVKTVSSSTPFGRVLSLRRKNKAGVLQPLETPMLSPVQSVVRRSDVRGQLVTSQTSLLEDDSLFDQEPPVKKPADQNKQFGEANYERKPSLKKSATVDLVSEPGEIKKPKMSKKKRHEESVSKARAFDEKMSREFEELEKFTLNIDDI